MRDKLKFVGYLIIIAGAIAFLVVWARIGFFTAFLSLLSSLFSGFLLLGVAEIIKKVEEVIDEIERQGKSIKDILDN